MTDKSPGPGPRGDLLPLDVEQRAWHVLRIAIVAGIVLFGLLRLANLTTDFPSELSWDGDAYSDEGLYAHNAITRVQDGMFHVPLDYNQFVALPLMPTIKAACFSVFGINLLTARLISVFFAFALGASLYYLVRRFEDHWTALLAVFILAMNHILFAFSRLALDEVPVTFLVTLTFAFAVRVRGDKWWLFAILTSVTFAAALMTKTSAIFATLPIAVVVILQELNLRRILLKFLLCSAVFLSIMGAWYVLLIKPSMVDFHYFFSLNLDLARAETFSQWALKLLRHLRVALNADPILPIGLLLLSLPLLVVSRRYRRHPLLYLTIAWLFLDLSLYAYYGRFYPRFFCMMIPPLSVWAAIALRSALELPTWSRLLAYLFVGVVALSSLWQSARTVDLVLYHADSFNEMAADILRHVEADPSGNRVIMGHTAANIALRTGLIPRNDRYSPSPMDERLKAFNPGWAISEGELRTFPLDPYYRHAEYFDLFYDIELVASYDTLDNYRGHKMHLYRLTSLDGFQYPTPFAHARLEQERTDVPSLPLAETPDLPQPIRLLGHDWERISTHASFGERYIHRGAVLDGRMFISGGFNDRDLFLGDVWSSADGANWRLEIGEAPWPARFAHGMVAHEGFLYVMGGYNGTLLNDVWKSPNGADWFLATHEAPWAPRTDFQAVSHNGAIYVLGGHGKGERYGDVWSTRDGIEWSLLTDNAWPRRSHFAAASHRGRILVAAGVDFDFDANRHQYRRDVWASADGQEWTLMNDKAQFRGRSLMQMISMGPTLFAIGGDDLPELAALRRDTWISHDGADWWRLVGTKTHGQRPYIEYELRINHVVLAKDDALFVIGGHQYDAGRFRGMGRYPGMWRNDNVWKSTGVHVISEVP